MFHPSKIISHDYWIVGGNMQRKILGKIILIVIGILFIVVTIFFVMSHKKEMIIEKANKAGLNVEFSGPKIFFIKEGPVTYCYDLEISGVKFNKYDISVEESGVKVKEGELIVSIKRKNKDGSQIKGRFHDTRIVIDDEGNEEILYSSMSFRCNSNFDRSSLVLSGVLDAAQKAIEAYENVTGYVPIEELKQYYKRAMDICNQLNG